jgi:predicted HAD superfamily Cof-like phosphohydrolase
MDEYLQFRVRFLEEELNEIKTQLDNPDEVVDGLIDLCVVAIGTLDAFGVDAEKAWNAVHKANMSKVLGVKKERPNPLGLPDLAKPEGWKSPSHVGNHGLIKGITPDPYDIPVIQDFSWRELLIGFFGSRKGNVNID